MKKKLLSLFLIVIVVVTYLSQEIITVCAASWNTSYSLTGNGANDIVAIAQAQLEKTQSQLGYSGNWCAAFVSDCAKLAGQSEAIPYHAAVSSLYTKVTAAGGKVVSSPQKGDIAFYKSGSSFCHVSIVSSNDGTTIHGNVSWCASKGRDDGLWHVCTRKPNVYENAMGQYHVYVRPNYKESTHTHNYNTYSHSLSAHPHYKCYKCSCGEVQTNKSETTYVSRCTTCNPKISFENIESGNYYIKQKGNGRYLSIADSEDKDLANVHTNDFGNYNSQVFSIYTTDYGYEMMPACSSTRVVNPSSTSVKSGNAVNLYSKSNKNSQSWKFQPLNGGYVIRNAKNTNVCISPGDGGMAVLEYAGWDSQIWFLEKCCTISFDAKGGENAPESQRMRAGYGTDLSSQKPTKAGYTFSGWATNSKATTVTYAAGANIKVQNDTTLYAVWKKCTHKYANNSDICSLCGFDKSGDVNGDGDITLDDVVLLAQFVAGWDVTLN